MFMGPFGMGGMGMGGMMPGMMPQPMQMPMMHNMMQTGAAQNANAGMPSMPNLVGVDAQTQTGTQTGAQTQFHSGYGLAAAGLGAMYMNPYLMYSMAPWMLLGG